MPKRIAPIAIALSLALAGTAQAKQYILEHPKHEHCKTHYVRKVRHIEKHKHGRHVTIKETVCVYVAPKAAAKTVPISPAAATPTPPPRAVHLKAHLDPSFTRNRSNPFAVTYAYSASASFESTNVAQVEPAPLPEGVLQLFSDGKLACSINVGASTAGGECPVTYPTLGEHTVVTTYTSGSTSVTETSMETIEPFSTTTNVSYTYAGETPLTIEAQVIDQEGFKAPLEAGMPTGCPAKVSLSIKGVAIQNSSSSSCQFTVYVYIEGEDIYFINAEATQIIKITATELAEGVVIAKAEYKGTPGYLPSTGTESIVSLGP